MAKQDFYDTLGVSKSASADELKRAYRKLAMQYHPDRNAGDKGAEQKFKDLNEAYDILKDDQKRAAYDRFGHAAFEQGGGRGPGDFGFAAGGFADIFDEMFGEFMGGGRRGQGGPNRGSDLRYNFEVSLEEACACNRVSSQWSKPAAAVRVPDGSSTIPAGRAVARVGRDAKGPCRSISRPGSRTAFGCGSPEKARSGSVAPRRAIFSSSFAWHRIGSSSAMGPISTAEYRFRSPPQPSAARSRCRPWTAAERASRCPPELNRGTSSGSGRRG